MRNIYSREVDYSKYVLPIEMGGTGARTLQQAAANLQLVTNDQIGQANGPVPLDANGKIPLVHIPDDILRTSVSIYGSAAIVTGQSIQFQITDFDSFKDYNIQASAGTIAQADDIIVYTAPATAQDVTFSIAGRQLTLEIITPQPARPTIAAPTNGASDLPYRIAVVASAFQAIGGVFTHLNTDWQVASDPGFTTIVYQSLADTSNKTSIDLVNLPNNQTLYLRCRYRGSDNSVGNYSTTVQFNTRAFYESVSEEAILLGDQGASFNSFGFSVSVTDDGNKATSIAYTGSSIYATRTYVFKKTNGSWSIEQSIDNTSDYPSNAIGPGSWRTGECAKISPDGTRLFLGESHNGDSLADAGNVFYSDGRIRVFLFNGTQWVLETTIPAHAQGTGERQGFGSHITCNNDASVMFTTAPIVGMGGTTPPGFYMYKRTGTVWNLVTAGGLDNLNSSISGIHMTPDGTRVVVSRHLPDTTNSTVVCASVYTVQANGFTIESNLSVTVGASKQRPGRSCCISADGATIAIGSGGTAISGGAPDQNALGASTGSVHVFTRTGSTWTHQTRLINDDVAVTEEFGRNVRLNIDGSVMMVTANRLNNGATSNQGAYYIFRKVSGNWTRSQTVRGTTQGAQQFGLSFDSNRTLTTTLASGANRVSVMV